MSTTTAASMGGRLNSARIAVQQFGSFLSRMVMPNIGAFIAWGLVTAFFIPTGWTPNEALAVLVGPTIKYLLPILISFTGGRIVYQLRGGVIAAVATMGVIIGSETVMLVGAMAMGPLAAWVLKQVEKLWAGKVKPGMEMLVDNFAIGIIGGAMMVFGLLAIEPIISAILAVLTVGVEFLVHNHLLPLTYIFVVPAQVLFLNNAINHGIMVPIGIQEVAETGKSLLFLVEANGGPWVGVALAFWLFGKGAAKRSAPGATLIMWLGGIAEVVFPYVLAKPKTIFGPMIGYALAMVTLQVLGGGTVGAVSPGSMFALIAMSPRGALFPNLAGYAVGVVVSAAVTGLLLKLERNKGEDEEESAVPVPSTGHVVSAVSQSAAGSIAFGNQPIRTVVFACDAGMGSSVMAESILKTKLTKAALQVSVKHVAVADLEDPADLFLTSAGLKDRVEATLVKKGISAPVIGLENLLDNKAYTDLVERIQQNNQGS